MDPSTFSQISNALGGVATPIAPLQMVPNLCGFENHTEIAGVAVPY